MQHTGGVGVAGARGFDDDGGGGTGLPSLAFAQQDNEVVAWRMLYHTPAARKVPK